MVKRHVLYVDDEKENLDAFRERFGERYAVHVAQSADAGLQVLRAHDIDVVLTDQQMPHVDGVEFLARVAREYPHTIRCVMTGFGDLHVVVDAINRGHVFHFFHKPWDAREIERVLDTAPARPAMRPVEPAGADASRTGDVMRQNALLEARVAVRTAELERVNYALRRSEAMFRSITAAAQSAIVMVDHNGHITLWNQAASRVFGWEAGEVVGKDVADVLIPESQRPNHNAGFDDFQRTGRGAFLGTLTELVAVHKLGHEIPIEMSLSVVLLDGKRSAVAIINDITARQQDKRALIDAREAAERANRAKSVFLANMSHEIRTPINAILGFSQLLHRDPLLPPEVVDKVTTIERAGEHLLDLINEVLEMAKIEAGQLEIHSATFDLRAMLNDLSRMFELRTAAKDVHFVTEFSRGLPRFITTDPVRLRQILVNLLGNATKFTRRGTVSLRACAPADFTLQIEVEDTGPGITESDHERVFEKFIQTNDGVDKGGTGLGLPISREYARLLGGELRLNSDGSHGSLFTLSIPFSHGGQSRPIRIESGRRVVGLRPDQRPIDVLVVDDESDSRAIMVGLLSAIGIRVREAVDGHGAIVAVAARVPDVVLMDLRMPGMDGYEATNHIARCIPRPKIITVSASAFGESRAAALSAGADAFLVKPFRESELFSVIQDATGVQFLYEDEREEPSSSFIVSLDSGGIPDELREAMRRATVDGDLDELLALIDRLDAQSELAGVLRRLANGFEYERLLQLLTKEHP